MPDEIVEPDETIELSTPDGPMPVYQARTDGRARGAVLVIQEAFGVNDHIKDVARRFASQGYHAVAPHLFHRTGGGTIPYDKFEDVMKHMGQLSDEGMLADFDATLHHLRKAGWTDGQIGAVGFCMGGRASFMLATKRRLGASVGFYGGGIVTARSPKLPALVGDVTSMQTPWLGLFGDADQGIPTADVEALRRALGQESEGDWEIVRYPDAEHGFHCDARPSFHAVAAADGWKRTLEWFDKHLSG